MKIVVFLLLSSLGIRVGAQTWSGLSYYTTAKILEMNPDSRSAGFGDIGVVSSTHYWDAGVYQNPALLSQGKDSAGVYLSYCPYLTRLSKRNVLMRAAGFYSLNSKTTLGVSLTGYRGAKIYLYSSSGSQVYTLKPSEQYLTLNISRALNPSFHAGAGIDIIHSSWFKGLESSEYAFRSYTTIALNLGFNYQKVLSGESVDPFTMSLGGAINHLGPRARITDDHSIQKYFLPATFSLGVLFDKTAHLSSNNKVDIIFAYQIEKQLVPSVPRYGNDSMTVIAEGKDPDISSFRAIYQSFYDSPDGMEGDLREFVHKLGVEIRVGEEDESFHYALRMGLNMQNKMEGNRNYLTVGLGVQVSRFSFNLSSYFKDNNPFDRTWVLAVGYRLP